MNLRVTTLGVQTAIRGLDKAIRTTAPRIQDGINRCLFAVLKKSRYYVPKDTHALEKSATVVPAQGVGYGARGYVQYGGAGVGYAVRVHEDMEMKHAPPTCAKFLERAVRELKGTMTQIMGRAVAGETTTLDLEAPETQPGD